MGAGTRATMCNGVSSPPSQCVCVCVCVCARARALRACVCVGVFPLQLGYQLSENGVRLVVI